VTDVDELGRRADVASVVDSSDRTTDRYRRLHDLAPIGLITTDANGKVIEANPAASASLDIDMRHLVGKPIFSFVVPEQRRDVRSWMVDLRRHGAEGELTVRMTRRSGVSFDAHVRLALLEREMAWTFVDVTVERQAEERLWEVNRQIDSLVARRVRELRSAYAELPVGVAIVDADTRRVRGKNRRAEEILEPWGGLIPGLEAAASDRSGAEQDSDPWHVDRALAGTRVWRNERRLRAPMGGEVVLELSSSPLHDDDGTVVAAVLSFDDVSERRKRDMADAEFVENAAHQLRTPITAVAIAAAALAAGAKDEPDERDRFVAHIARESDRMARAIESLLALARIQRGGSALLVSVVPLEPFLRDIVDETNPRPGVEIKIVCATDLAIVGDASILREAIANVVRNAALHTVAGEIRLTAQRRHSNTILDVADTGPGIPAEVRPRIFERFYQGRNGSRGGAGLGLSIAAEAARANGGALELLETAVGTTFRFTLRGAKLL